jgi:hypothetical protein
MINWNESFNTEIKELPDILQDIGMKNYFIIHHEKRVNEEGYTYSSYSNPWKLDSETLTSWVNEQYAY